MTVESAADRLSFLSDFGQTVVHSGGNFTAIFDKEFIEVDPDQERGIASNMPILTCRDSDIAAVTYGDTVTTGGTGYTVQGVEPDGTGMTVLILEKQ